MSENKKKQFVGFGYDIPGNLTRINIPLSDLKKMVTDLEHFKEEIKEHEGIDVLNLGLSVRLDEYTDLITAQYYYEKEENNAEA